MYIPNPIQKDLIRIINLLNKKVFKLYLYLRLKNNS